ncbi:MAG TPA: hypothetical protein VFO27_13990 [Bryobacteraceae bacterium]|nr:hypothetical protein [Bryobacteraceae bacterium]
MDVILFLIFALIAVVCAVNVVVQTHPIASAISLVGGPFSHRAGESPRDLARGGAFMTLLPFVFCLLSFDSVLPWT